MNRPPASGQTSHYTLQSDLARLCLPAEYRDTNRTLAYANSICALFLAIGLVGLKAPELIFRPLSEVSDPVPVIIEQLPEQVQRVEPEIKEDEPPPLDTPTDIPQVAAIVAAADSANVAFSVPVEGAVAVMPNARYAPPPPRITQAPPAQPSQFRQNSVQGAVTPDPAFPASAQRKGYEGSVVVEFTVDNTGSVGNVKVQKSSGYLALDEAALTVVRQRWRFPPEKAGFYFWKCTFVLPK